MTKEARRRGVKFRLARVWESTDRGLEKELKAKKAGKAICPICSPEARAVVDAQIAEKIRTAPLDDEPYTDSERSADEAARRET